MVFVTIHAETRVVVLIVLSSNCVQCHRRMIVLLVTLFFRWSHASCSLDRERPAALIVGQVKAGTTALFSAMRRNERNKKELYFFNDDERFGRGAEYYAQELLGCDDGGMSIDATPLYLVNRVALARAGEMVPWAKMLVMVREPSDRAYSHYNMLGRFAKGGFVTFHDLIRPELDCYKNSSSWRAGFDECFEAGRAPLALVGKLAYRGAASGLLSHGILVPQLEQIRQNEIILVSQLALYRTGSTIVEKIFEVLGLPGPAAPVKKYESLSNHSWFDFHTGDFEGHRSRITPASLLSELDSFFSAPNRALADYICGTSSITTLGLREQDAHWLPVQCGGSGGGRDEL